MGNRARVSEPLLDRIDMHVPVAALPRDQLIKKSNESAESSERVRQRVVSARERQTRRQGKPNAQLVNSEIEQLISPGEEHRQLLGKAMDRLNLSAHAYHRILRVARTLADLEGSDELNIDHLSEAIGYRNLEKY